MSVDSGFSWSSDGPDHRRFSRRSIILNEAEFTASMSPKGVKSFLKKHGIDWRDPRVRPLMGQLESDIRTMSFDEICAKYSILNDVIQGHLVIPDFEFFSNQITQIYMSIIGNRSGKIATYIPQLAKVDPDMLGISICTIDSQRFSIGDHKEEFCVQSCGKPITYCIAIELNGEEKVHSIVNREPSGRNFNDLSLDRTGKPHNPMINSGSISCCSMVMPNKPLSKRFDHIMSVWKKLAGNDILDFDNSVYLSERINASRNYCLGYMLKEAGCLDESCDMLKTLELYFMTCCISVNCDSLSVIAATLANGGVCPMTGERVFSVNTVKDCLSLMFMCGMYEFSGEFAYSVGFPSKSGISGALMIVIPGVLGAAVWSPRLDEYGISVRGVEFCKQLSQRFYFHNFELHQGRYPNSSLEGDQIDSTREEKYNPVAEHEVSSLEDIMSTLDAASRGDIRVLQQQLCRGTKINACDYDGRTALHLAASEGQTEAAKYLIHHGASIKVLDAFNNSPIDDARRGKFSDIIQGFEKLIENWKPRPETSNESDPITRCFRALHLPRESGIRLSNLIEVMKDKGIFDEALMMKALDVGHPEDLPKLISNLEQFYKLCELNPNIVRGLQGNLVIDGFGMVVDKMTKIYQEVRSLPQEGDVATYIPQLANTDPNLLGVSICTIHGQRANIGDATVKFSIQAASKPVIFCIAQEMYGDEAIKKRIGHEPSGRSFNDLSLNFKKQPHNPMVNSGALVGCSLLMPGSSTADRFDYVMSVFAQLFGDKKPAFSNETFLSEMDASDRNYCIAYMLEENGCIDPGINVDHVLKLYLQLCSIESTCEQMSILAATLANDGVNPITGKRVFKSTTVKNCLSLMYSCGMNDDSGGFSFRVGIPAKSGISGVIFSVIPGLMGICTYSPCVNNGNSIKGIKFYEKLVKTFNFHNFARLPGAHECKVLYFPFLIRRKNRS
eukprot:TRINITY_DN2505_c0_g3_i5.p1 TRINITY_DN2505_c0_g3~~TRINITY_DN2505_c0_g3_i5.p1  ORF type:complete len:955 (+),score=137.49 TRINITY_DN2505_c0_g3_i5:72-2936(+)